MTPLKTLKRIFEREITRINTRSEKEGLDFTGVNKLRSLVDSYTKLRAHIDLDEADDEYTNMESGIIEAELRKIEKESKIKERERETNTTRKTSSAEDEESTLE